LFAPLDASFLDRCTQLTTVSLLGSRRAAAAASASGGGASRDDENWILVAVAAGTREV
jgi:hypothetical protein